MGNKTHFCEECRREFHREPDQYGMVSCPYCYRDYLYDLKTYQQRKLLDKLKRAGIVTWQDAPHPTTC